MHLDYTALSEQYAVQGIGRPIPMGERPALVVVDFTRGFTDAASPIGVDLTAAVLRTAELLELARAAGLPVVYTTNVFRPDLGDAGVWAEKYPGLQHLALGGPWVEIDERIAPLPRELVIEKRFPSAFFGTAMSTVLTAARVDSLLIAGTTTSGCIRATAVDALQLGYRTTVVEDCVADRHEAPHQANLFDLRHKYANVQLLDEVRPLLGAAQINR